MGILICLKVPKCSTAGHVLAFALMAGLVTACGGSDSNTTNFAHTLDNFSEVTPANIDDVLDQIPGNAGGLNPDFQTPSVRTLNWPGDFPAALRAGLTDTVLVTGLPTQVAYDFDVTLPASVGENTTLFVLNLSEDQQAGGSVCYGDPDCTGTVTLATVSLQLVSFDTGTASIAITPSSSPALVNEGNATNPVNLALSEGELSYSGTVGPNQATETQLNSGESFYRLTGLTAGSRYEVTLIESGDDDVEMSVSNTDGSDAECDPSYSNASRCVLVANARELDLHIEGNRSLFGASFTLNASEVSAKSAFEGSWHAPVLLPVPDSAITYHFGQSDNFSSYYSMTGLDPNRRYRILLSGNYTSARLQLNSPLTSLPVYAPQCAVLDEDNSTGEQACVIEQAIYVYFRVESVSESSQYLLSVEASHPDEGTPQDPVVLQLDDQSRLLREGTVISDSVYTIKGFSPGQTYLLQPHSAYRRLDTSLSTSSSDEVDCNGSFHYDCVFTAAETDLNLTVSDSYSDIGQRYVLSVLPTKVPNRVYPEPAAEDLNLHRSMLPYAGKVSSYFSNYQITGLEPYAKYLVTLSDNSERMSLSAWPGEDLTIQCTRYTKHPFGTDCISNADSNGAINVRIGGDDAGGQFTIDMFEAQLTADYHSNDTPLTIPDNTNPGVGSTININDSAVTEIVEVVLQVEHGYSEDLQISLEAPNGQRVALSEHVPAVELGHTVYSDLAVLSNAGGGYSYSSSGVAVLRAYRPDELLYKLRGINRSGNWTLHVADTVYTNRSDAIGGMLIGWGLRFSALAE